MHEGASRNIGMARREVALEKLLPLELLLKPESNIARFANPTHVTSQPVGSAVLDPGFAKPFARKLGTNNFKTQARAVTV